MAWCSTCGDRLPDGSRYCLTCQRLLEKNEIRRSPLFPVAKALEKGKQQQQQQKKKLTGFQKSLMMGLVVGYMILSELVDTGASPFLGTLLLLFAFLAVSYLPKLFDRSGETVSGTAPGTAPGAAPGTAPDPDAEQAEEAPGWYPTISGVEQWGDDDQR